VIVARPSPRAGRVSQRIEEARRPRPEPTNGQAIAMPVLRFGWSRTRQFLPRSHPNGRETDVVVEWNVLAIRASSARTPVLDRLCFPPAPKMNSRELARQNNAIEGRGSGVDREFRSCPPRPVSSLHRHGSNPFEPNPTTPHTRRHQRAHAGAWRHTRIKPDPGPLPVLGNDRRRRQHLHPALVRQRRPVLVARCQPIPPARLDKLHVNLKLLRQNRPACRHQPDHQQTKALRKSYFHNPVSPWSAVCPAGAPQSGSAAVWERRSLGAPQSLCGSPGLCAPPVRATSAGSGARACRAGAAHKHVEPQKDCGAPTGHARAASFGSWGRASDGRGTGDIACVMGSWSERSAGGYRGDEFPLRLMVMRICFA
jgi:hypothetical protein